MKRDFRRPLIIMTPKSLLRHPKVHSSVDELSKGPFQEVLPDTKVFDLKKIETIILCSGKVYYDLDSARDDKGFDDKKFILRVEQIAPFPKIQLATYLNGAPKLKKLIWCQEEPENMGAYSYVAPRLRKLLDELGHRKIEIEYVGRVERSSPAVGSPKVHQKEQETLINKTLGL
jgi:2-oxoglutarate dehydrogenase E1 component